MSDVDMNEAPVIRDLGESIKPKSPGPFDGTPSQLRGFLTQLKMYHRMFPTKLSREIDRILHAGTCLTGTALAWFEPRMRDFMETENEALRDEETNLIFENFDGFEEAITNVFGNTDEMRMAVEALQHVKQTGSASDYVAKFRQLASKTGWDDEPLMPYFFNGLKLEVQDKLFEKDLPDTLTEYMNTAVRIDNRLYLKRKVLGKQNRFIPNNQGRNNHNRGNNQRYRANEGRPRNSPWTRQTEPMDLDALQKTLAAMDKKNITCYGCGKKGHIKRECRSSKEKERSKDWKAVPEGKPKQLNMTRSAYETQDNGKETPWDYFKLLSGNWGEYGPHTKEIQESLDDWHNRCEERQRERIDNLEGRKMNNPSPHAALHWSGCYDDDCPIHLEGKDNSKWFPKAPKHTKDRTLAVMRKIDNRRRKEPLNKTAVKEADTSSEDDDDKMDESWDDPRTILDMNHQMIRVDNPRLQKDPAGPTNNLQPPSSLHLRLQMREDRPLKGPVYNPYGKERNEQIVQQMDKEFADEVRQRTLENDAQSSAEETESLSDGESLLQEKRMLETTLLHGRATQQQWIDAALDRYDPLPRGEDLWIVILAWTINGGTQWVIDNRRLEGDDPDLHPDEPGHKKIAWISCIYHFCPIHALAKGRHQVYPTRGPLNRTIHDPYLQGEAEFYELCYREKGTGCVMLRQSARCPESCAREQTQWEECPATECPKHAKEKIFDWHTTRERKEESRLQRSKDKTERQKWKDIFNPVEAGPAERGAARILKSIYDIEVSGDCALDYGRMLCFGCRRHKQTIEGVHIMTNTEDPNCGHNTWNFCYGCKTHETVPRTKETQTSCNFLQPTPCDGCIVCGYPGKRETSTLPYQDNWGIASGDHDYYDKEPETKNL
jgi:hypothetical protein